MIRAPWSHGTPEGESRAFLQERLALLLKVLFWCFVVLMAFVAIAYWVYRDHVPAIVPAYQWLVWCAFAVGLTSQAFVWRVLLLRKTLTFEQLHAIDLVFAIGANAIIAACAVFAYDQRQSGYTCLIYTCWTVLTRALIVPSTGTRTAIITAIAMIPMGIAVVILASIAHWPGPKDVPPVALFVGYAQIACVAVLLAAQGSRIIYGLRAKISQAQQLGQYTLVRKIGEGGMGAVYLAHHVMLRRPTAVKLLLPDRIGHDNLVRFEREVHHMSQLTHPNTVAVFDYGRSPDGVFYYAMEYLGGGINLESLVLMHGPQPPERVRQIILQVCGALAEAHDRGIVHRDIKPANIIVCERGAMTDVVKVVDFGLVKEIADDSGGSAQAVLGTPAYLAPEVISSPASVGAAADLYALGCVAYFLLAGRRVFDGKSALELCNQHINQQPEPPRGPALDVPRGLEDLVMQCLAKQPAARPASALALADALRALGPVGDWNEDRANAWWNEFRPPDPSKAATPTPTETMTIDFADREEAA